MLATRLLASALAVAGTLAAPWYPRVSAPATLIAEVAPEGPRTPRAAVEPKVDSIEKAMREVEEGVARLEKKAAATVATHLALQGAAAGRLVRLERREGAASSSLGVSAAEQPAAQANATRPPTWQGGVGPGSLVRDAVRTVESMARGVVDAAEGAVGKGSALWVNVNSSPNERASVPLSNSSPTYPVGGLVPAQLTLGGIGQVNTSRVSDAVRSIESMASGVVSAASGVFREGNTSLKHAPQDSTSPTESATAREKIDKPVYLLSGVESMANSILHVAKGLVGEGTASSTVGGSHASMAAMASGARGDASLDHTNNSASSPMAKASKAEADGSETLLRFVASSATWMKKSVEQAYALEAKINESLASNVDNPPTAVTEDNETDATAKVHRLLSNAKEAAEWWKKAMDDAMEIEMETDPSVNVTAAKEVEGAADAEVAGMGGGRPKMASESGTDRPP